MHPAFGQTDHRPLPMPGGPWVMSMKWHDLLFAHWRVPVEDLHSHVPEELEIDTFDGSAWLAITPFWMSGVRPRMTPDALGLRLPELNVRTYVTAMDRPGVWFFSLDAGSRLAVRMARKFYFLPYFDADMTCEPGEWVEFSSRRTERSGGEASLIARYRPAGDVFTSEPGSLEHFLTERYVLFSRSYKGGLYLAEIQHPQWPLQKAEAEFRVNTMTESLGIQISENAPLLHFAKKLDIVAWYPRPLR